MSAEDMMNLTLAAVVAVRTSAILPSGNPG
jgi:hypothetical protein